jgi:hypothetical protein
MFEIGDVGEPEKKMDLKNASVLALICELSSRKLNSKDIVALQSLRVTGEKSPGIMEKTGQPIEKPNQLELNPMIKYAAVFDMGRDGNFVLKGDKETMGILKEATFNKEVDFISEERPSLVLLPLSNSNISEKVLPKFDKGDTAICFAIRGKHTDSHDRSGKFTGIAIMSDIDAQKFMEGVKATPQLLYSLAVEVNGDVFRNYKGEPMDVPSGDCVKIFPNGRMGKPIMSGSFPKDYKPNMPPS